MKKTTIDYSIKTLAAGLGVAEYRIAAEFSKRGFSRSDKRSFKALIASDEIAKIYRSASK